MQKFSQQLIVQCNESFREILMAEMAAIDFDSFQETDTGFAAHAKAGLNEEDIKGVLSRYEHVAEASYQIEEVELQNWNKKWEESYDPINVDNKVFVRATFHEAKPEIPIEIIINPKMSFGTGHHETTYLMMKSQLEIDHKNKSVLDAGCGTGILSILAGKLGASSLVAYDNDPWVEDNIQENFKINNVRSEIFIGTVSDLSHGRNFDIVLANINKNVLLHEITHYASLLATSGRLLLSGFYVYDLPDILKEAEGNGLELEKTDDKSEWMTARFLKK
jgi:ribosomal protein L11 methyltransferase